MDWGQLRLTMDALPSSSVFSSLTWSPLVNQISIQTYLPPLKDIQPILGENDAWAMGQLGGSYTIPR